jgi:hypothetical protein
MYIFIDESGTHKQSGRAAVVLVYVEVSSLEDFENTVEEIEKDLKIQYFHWTDESWNTRKNFITQIMKTDFTLKVAILENPVKLSLSIEDALKHLVVEKKIQKITIDGRKPKWYMLKLKKILRDKGVSVKKVVTVRKDESSPGIRAADCFAGLVRYYHNKPTSLVKGCYEKLKRSNRIKFELIAL